MLTRAPLGETSTLLTLLTPTLGLVRARAQGSRGSGAKLAAALTSFTESDIILVRGKEGWRIAGATVVTAWYRELPSRLARVCAARIVGLVTRLVAGEASDPALFDTLRAYFEALVHSRESHYEAAEILAALRILSALGLDAGDSLGEVTDYSEPLLARVTVTRTEYIARINRGIAASEL